ncbi:hypothetical protein H9655_21585 [Cytobacillus sp. Sa5YUA1]|uniref:Uncharacterized protein n=1 Tax=Cytobacillus stercorigallinarum TaxID=2762240 RepID=A0ABR8QVV3_9BACI|nr:hypothetical protein [Cytobacillus stercorigallinarum]MBD7939639.1 hypothetical protein [Cytobacillus stercorigallinarum]
MTKRKPVFNCRTSQMSDEMYEHVEKRIKKTPDKSFRAYAFELIERDMNEKNEKKEMQNLYNLLQEMQNQMKEEFSYLHKKIDQKSFSPDNQDIHFQEKTDLKEGDLITDEVTGSIDEEYDMDF